MQDAEIVFSGGSLASVLSFLENSDCLSVLPEKTIRTIGPLFRVRQVPVEVRTARRALGILTRPVDDLDFVTKTMVEFLIDHVADG